uniref:Uncharacterized protein n=1 Tax=Arundo donax TaxID=35708 RepID=A0A0A8YQ66_ARUDO
MHSNSEFFYKIHLKSCSWTSFNVIGVYGFFVWLYLDLPVFADRRFDVDVSDHRRTLIHED